MKQRIACAAGVLGASLALAAELVTLSPANYEEYAPKGKEADAVFGDYVLRNDRIIVAVADPTLLSGRSASRWAIHTVAGAVIDLTLRDAPNDQLVAYYPGPLRFKPDAPAFQREFRDESAAADEPGRQPVSSRSVTLRLDGYQIATGRSLDELARLPANLRGAPLPSVQITYTLADGWPYLRVEAVYTNPTAQAFTPPLDTTLRAEGTFAASSAYGGRLFCVQDPWWRQAYGVLAEGHAIRGTSHAPRFRLTQIDPDSRPPGIPPGGSLRVVRYLIPGPGLHAIHEAAATLLAAPLETPPSPAAPPPGGTVSATITDESGSTLPCKVSFHGRDGAPNPYFFPETGEELVRNLVYSRTGRFDQLLPAGRYDVVASHGPEYDAAFTDIVVAAGQVTPLRVTLKRTVRTTGWISAETHNHSTRSGYSEIFYVYPYEKDPTADGDSCASTRGRVLNLLAEQIEFAPPTEHNYASSYTPLLRQLSAEALLATAPGIGLTAGRRHTVNHQNAFPVPCVPGRQDGGALQRPEHVGQLAWLAAWLTGGEKLIQIVQPRGDDLAVTREMDVLDVVELEPIVSGQPIAGMDNRILDWIAKLNDGYRLPAVANAGAFDNYHGSGRIRNYVRSATDDPAQVRADEVVRSIRRGQVVMTTGPFLTVEAQDARRSAWRPAGPGETISLPHGQIGMRIRVECANWVGVDRVEVLANGRPCWSAAVSGTPFEQRVLLALTNDSHLIVVASGDAPSLRSPVFSPTNRTRHVAVSNPIYVDVGQDGYRPASPLDDQVDAALEFIVPPLAAAGAESGRVRMTLTNRGGTPAADAAALEVVPERAAEIIGPPARTYSVAAGGEASLDWPLALRDEFLNETFPVRSTYNNVGTFGLRVARSGVPPGRRGARTWMEVDHPVASLPSIATPADIPAALAPERPFPVRPRNPPDFGQIRLGVSGRNLAVLAVVSDAMPQVRDIVWEGSCLELFGSMPGRDTAQNTNVYGAHYPIRQIYLTPPIGHAPPRAWRRDGERIVPAPGIAIEGEAGPAGYELRALVPLDLLGVSIDAIQRMAYRAAGQTPVHLLGEEARAGRFLLEARITIPDAAGGPPRRATIFGSNSPHNDSNAFGRMRLVGPVGCTLEIVRPASLAPGADAAVVRMHLTNQTDRAAEDTVTLVTEPRGAIEVLGTNVFTYALAPREAIAHEFRLAAATGESAPAELPSLVHLVVPRSPRGEVVRTGSPALPIGDRPMGAVPVVGIDAVASALAGQTGLPLRSRASVLGAARVAIAESNALLYVHATVRDASIAQASPPWKGSCFEIFSAAGPTGAIAHLFLVPPAGGQPARALRAGAGGALTPSEAAVAGAASRDGYRLQAAVPFGELGIASNAAGLMLELQVSTTQDGQREFGTAFGSPRAYQDTTYYGRFQLPTARSRR